MEEWDGWSKRKRIVGGGMDSSVAQGRTGHADERLFMIDNAQICDRSFESVPTHALIGLAPTNIQPTPTTTELKTTAKMAGGASCATESRTSIKIQLVGSR